ncbi:hypothetical protein [Paraburkholderia domus]
MDVSALTQSLKGASSGIVRKNSRAVHYVTIPDLLRGS